MTVVRPVSDLGNNGTHLHLCHAFSNLFIYVSASKPIEIFPTAFTSELSDLAEIKTKLSKNHVFDVEENWACITCVGFD